MLCIVQKVGRSVASFLKETRAVEAELSQCVDSACSVTSAVEAVWHPFLSLDFSSH